MKASHKLARFVQANLIFGISMLIAMLMTLTPLVLIPKVQHAAFVSIAFGATVAGLCVYAKSFIPAHKQSTNTAKWFICIASISFRSLLGVYPCLVVSFIRPDLDAFSRVCIWLFVYWVTDDYLPSIRERVTVAARTQN